VVGEKDVRSVVVVVVWSVCDVGRLSVSLVEVGLHGSGLVPLGACVIRWTVGLVLIWYVGVSSKTRQRHLLSATLRSVNHRL
jgi:hypothetical protein